MYNDGELRFYLGYTDRILWKNLDWLEKIKKSSDRYQILNQHKP